MTNLPVWGHQQIPEDAELTESFNLVTVTVTVPHHHQSMRPDEEGVQTAQNAATQRLREIAALQFPEANVVIGATVDFRLVQDPEDKYYSFTIATAQGTPVRLDGDKFLAPEHNSAVS